MAGACRRVLDLAATVAGAGNPLLASDAGVAALLAEAALRASAINVRVNLGAGAGRGLRRRHRGGAGRAPGGDSRP